MAVVAVAAWRWRSAWQHGGSAAVAQRHRGMAVAAITTAVLPPRVTAVAIKTPVATAVVGAQSINNQLKAVMVTATEAATMAANWRECSVGGGGQLGSGGGSLARAR